MCRVHFLSLFLDERDGNVTARRSRSIRLWHRSSISRVRCAFECGVHRREMSGGRISHARAILIVSLQEFLDLASRYDASR